MVFLKILLIIYPKNDKQSMVIKACSRLTKQVFLKISQNAQENTSAGVSSNKKFADLQPATLSNKRLQHRCFPVDSAKLNTLTKHLRPTRPMPKFQPPAPTPKFYGPTPTRQNLDLRHQCLFWTHANFFGPTLFSSFATYVCSVTAAFILSGTIASASN